MTTQPVPIPYAYWVIPGHLLAGEHPGAADETEARGTLQRLLHAGITVFIDLTEAGEWDAYDHLLQEAACPVTYHRIPIVDGQPPSEGQMREIMLIIDAARVAQRAVYVHCAAGIGRTGAVVGCYLVHLGRNPPAALREIARRRRTLPNGHMQSPATEVQRQFVLQWTEAKEER